MNKKILIAIGLTILFLGNCITPTVANDNLKISSIPFSKGKTLYVGGTGEGNYSTIQDAIDDSVDGDTVFVYDDSSPYHELHILIDKSINLIGENKETTVIDGNNCEWGSVIRLVANSVNINGFTIRNGYEGISIGSNYNIISGNKITDCEWCIHFPEGSSNNILSGNIVTLSNYSGIFLYCCNNNTISNNIITSNIEAGIADYLCYNNTIMDNIITLNKKGGIYLCMSSNYTIFGNNITMNTMYGIEIYSSDYNKIIRNNIQKNYISGLRFDHAHYNLIESNNFIENKIQASFKFSRKNNWVENYWDNWIGFRVNKPIFHKFPKIIYGFLGVYIDWRPAKKPYDIDF
jgi:parallel beta-helix repeat protein